MQKIIKDKKGREIELYLDDNDTMHAIYENKIIGNFSYEKSEYPMGYDDYCEERFELHLMHIDKDYQGSGIGTEMIIFGEEELKNVRYAEDTGSSHGNHLSSEGKHLIDSCIRNGIISDPNQEEDYDYDY